MHKLLHFFYRHPNDMDLFTAAISEKHLPGSKLGPTFSCILALQFRALKYGDRFFYEGNTAHNPHPFTLPELDSIRQVTLAKVICDNTDITSLPKDVFLLPNPVT
jgi:peroxidase